MSDQVIDQASAAPTTTTPVVPMTTVKLVDGVRPEVKVAETQEKMWELKKRNEVRKLSEKEVISLAQQGWDYSDKMKALGQGTQLLQAIANDPEATEFLQNHFSQKGAKKPAQVKPSEEEPEDETQEQFKERIKSEIFKEQEEREMVQKFNSNLSRDMTEANKLYPDVDSKIALSYLKDAINSPDPRMHSHTYLSIAKGLHEYFEHIVTQRINKNITAKPKSPPQTVNGQPAPSLVKAKHYAFGSNESRAELEDALSRFKKKE